MSQFGLVRRIIAAPKRPVQQVAAILLAVAVAALLRWTVDRGAAGVPFLTFVPVVMIAAILLEWPYAVLAALASLGTVVGLFGVVARLRFTTENYILWVAFGFVAAFMIVTGHILRRTIMELEEQTSKTRAFNAELQHRTKNTIQVVRALASRAARTTDPVEFYETLAGRLDALAKANELLGPGTFQACAVADLVTAAMQPFPAAAIDAGGPYCAVAGDSGTQLMMALHELGTNAVKYGAFSADAGRVRIDWTPCDGTVELFWQESGGPPVTPPAKKGLGSRMLSPGGPLKAVDLDFRPEGLTCRLVVTAHPNA